MAVIVDNFRVPKRIGRISGRWSHLTADTPDELHAFADKLGLQRAWYQDKGDGRWHYDVVDSKRDEAIRLGAKKVDIREMGDFVRRRRLAAASIPDLDFAEFYGVKVSSIGEDGELVALGHHDKRTALAVFNAYVRHQLGFTGLHDYNSNHIRDPYKRISQSWAVVKTACDQPDCEGDECGECAEIKSHSWWLQLNQSLSAAGVFPVTDWA